jgi:propanol-preferring alcohol dehydrogenase
MKAMVLHKPGERLRQEDVAIPEPLPGELLIRIEACGVCRTDLHIIDGELTRPKLPLIPGHEIVGRVQRINAEGTDFRIGQRVGVPWLGSTCGSCPYCATKRENLCDAPRFTGYDINGGYAEYCAADARYCFPLDETADPVHLAPLLCAGLIGYRSLRLAGEGEHLGIYGFGAAAHLVAQVARFEGRRVYAFTRPADLAAQKLARELDCDWTGDSNTEPPVKLDAAIIFAPVGALVPAALTVLRKGGTVVCGGIHMSTIPAFDYNLLWGERVVRSVANLTREDATECLELASRIPIRTRTEPFSLAEANLALARLRGGRIAGAAVLVP